MKEQWNIQFEPAIWQPCANFPLASAEMEIADMNGYHLVVCKTIMGDWMGSVDGEAIAGFATADHAKVNTAARAQSKIMALVNDAKAIHERFCASQEGCLDHA